jgi:hypothetical protein
MTRDDEFVPKESVQEEGEGPSGEVSDEVSDEVRE